MTMELEKNRYVMVSHINEGAYASVSLALDSLEDSTPVAFKCIFPAKYHAARCRKEAHIHRLFSAHPNVATLYAAGKCGDTYAMVMELGERDLLETIEPDVGLGEEKALLYTAQIISALEFMHANSFVHRDIKPENIALMSDGRVCLIDFGHAAHFSEVGPKNARIGTAQYLAPECAAGHPVDPAKMDIFSAGVCMFAIATGRFPWISASMKDQEYCAWVEGRPSLKNKSYWQSLSPQMLCLLSGMLNAEPAKRWTATKVREYITLIASCDDRAKVEVSNQKRMEMECKMLSGQRSLTSTKSANFIDVDSNNDVVSGRAPLLCC